MSPRVGLPEPRGDGRGEIGVRADPAFIRLDGVYKVHRVGETGVAALGGVTLDVARGAFVAIVGPSGSGKSTILNLIGSLETATAGSVRVDGTDLSQLDAAKRSEYRRHMVGFLWQGATKNLVPYLTAFQNVELPMLLAGGTRFAPRRRRVSELLEIFGLTGRANHLPALLSGGEQQRVALAVALVNEPPLLLADEPTAEIDTEASVTVVEALRSASRKLEATVVMATHDLLAASTADMTYRLLDGRLRGPAGSATLDASGHLVLPDRVAGLLGRIGSAIEVEIEGDDVRLRRAADAPPIAARDFDGSGGGATPAGVVVDETGSRDGGGGKAGSDVEGSPILLSAHDLSRSYATGALATTALRDVSLTLRVGEMLAVMGPSGSGKSTLLGLLAGLETPDVGGVWWEGRPLDRITATERARARATRFGIVFQALGLFPWLTARENVVLPLVVSGAAPTLAAERAESWLGRLGLGDRLEHRTNDLSLGQQQRVAIARALAPDPTIVLCDEPTAEVDHEAASLIMETLREVTRRGGGVVIASHDPRVLREVDRVLVLRDGIVVTEGPPREVARFLTTD